MLRTTTLAGALSVVLTGAAVTDAHADCAFENDTPVRVLAADTRAWKAVTDAMAECGQVDADLDQDVRVEQPEAFAADPPLYQIGGVTNASLVPLMDQGSIRPLDDLVAEHGQDLAPNQLIKVDGKIMAIAMALDAQHLMYREDILNDLGIPVPASYDEVLAAAEKIEAAGLAEHALGGTYKTGWDLAQEFVNMHLGFGGDFFDDDGKPAINDGNGIAALEMMKALSAHMAPDYLEADAAAVQEQFRQGEIALATFWGSRAKAVSEEGEREAAGTVKMVKAPAARPESLPASTVWWDGFVIAKAISDQEAEAAFKVALEGMDSDMVKGANDAAVWLLDGYELTPLSTGVVETVVSGTTFYPSTAEMSLLHKLLGDGLTDYMTGDKDAATTLADIEAAYLDAAKEAGLID